VAETRTHLDAVAVLEQGDRRDFEALVAFAQL
jgi:hypothetical protein